MKKVLSFVLALIMVLSLSAVAFANTVEATGTDAEVSIGEDQTIQLGIGDGDGETEEKVNPDKPGATYYFSLIDSKGALLEVGGETETIKDVDDYVKHLSVKVTETGKMIKDYYITKHNSVYKLKVLTNDFYTVDEAKSTWTITMKRNDRLTVLSAEYTAVQAWADLDAKHYDDESYEGEVYIEVPAYCSIECGLDDCKLVEDDCAVEPGDGYDKEYTDDHNLGTVVTISGDAKYFEMFTGAKVWFSGKNTHKVEGVVMYTEGTGDKALYVENGAEEIYTIAFKGDMEFDYPATQHVTAGKSDFVYAVEDGKYVAGKFEWNEKAECWETKTMAPIDVLVSDVELKGAAAEAAADKANPGTGSVDFVNVAVALGIVSLAAAGAVALKK